MLTATTTTTTTTTTTSSVTSLLTSGDMAVAAILATAIFIALLITYELAQGHSEIKNQKLLYVSMAPLCLLFVLKVVWTLIGLF